MVSLSHLIEACSRHLRVYPIRCVTCDPTATSPSEPGYCGDMEVPPTSNSTHAWGFCDDFCKHQVTNMRARSTTMLQEAKYYSQSAPSQVTNSI